MHFSLGFKWYLRQYETSAITNEIEKSKTAFNMFCGNIQNTMNHRLGHLHIECEFLKGFDNIRKMYALQLHVHASIIL